MALDDQLNPPGILSDLIAQHEPDLVQNRQVEPQAVMNRLLRQFAPGTPGPEPVRARNAKPPQQKEPVDYGSFGDDLGGAPVGDYGQFGTDVDEKKEGAGIGKEGGIGVGGNVWAGVKGLASGAVETAGRELEAAGIGTQALENAPAEMIPEAIPGIGEWAAGKKYEPPGQKTTLEQNPLYRAGKATRKFGEEHVPMSQAEKESLGGQVGTGVGGLAAMAPGIVAGGAIGGVPGAMTAGAVQMAATAGADTFEKAIEKEGISKKTAAEVGGIDALANFVLGYLPMGTLVHRFEQVVPGLHGWLGTKLKQAIANGAVFTGFGEAQQYLSTLLAKEYYDPNAKWSPDAKRALAEFLTGAIASLPMPTRERSAQQKTRRDEDETGNKKDEETPPPVPPGKDETETETDRGKTDTSRPNGSPRANDPYDPEFEWSDVRGNKFSGTWYRDVGGTRYHFDPGSAHWFSEDERAGEQERQDQWRQHQQQQQQGQQQTGAGAQPNADTAARAQWQKQWDTTPPPTAEDLARRRRKTYANLAKEYGFSDEELKNATTDELYEWWHGTDVLASHGYSKKEIAAMSPKDMKAALDEATGHGAYHGEEPAAEGTRENPSEDIRTAAGKASQDHTPKQGEANNTQRGHYVWDDDMGVTIEAPAGGVRRGVAPDGTPFEQRFTHDHGYFKGVKGADGQEADVTVGPHKQSPAVFVIDEIDPKTGKFRQTKSFVNFHTPDEAFQAYLGQEGKTPDMIGGMAAFQRGDFKDMAKAGGLAKPVAPRPEPTQKATKATEPQPAAPIYNESPIHAALAQVGENPSDHPPEVMQAAAKMIAEEGLHPAEAFQRALVRHAVETGAMTEEQAKQVYGEKVSNVLEPRVPSEGGVSPAAPSAGPGGETAASAEGKAAEGKPRKVVSGGGETGEGVRTEGAGGKREAATAGGAETGGSAAVHPAGGERGPSADAGGTPGTSGAGARVSAAEAAGTAKGAVGDAKQRISDALKQLKYPVEGFLSDHMDRAAKLVADHGLEPLEAIERSMIEIEQEEGMVTAADPDFVKPEDLHAVQSVETPEKGEAAAHEGAAPAKAEAHASAETGGHAPSTGAKAQQQPGPRHGATSAAGHGGKPDEASEHGTPAEAGGKRPSAGRPEQPAAAGKPEREPSGGERGPERESADVEKDAAEYRKKAELARKVQGRLFPSYTTAELKKNLSTETDPWVRARMEVEIEARASGASKVKVTPQIGGAGAWEQVGKNEKGQILYEDQRGVRSYIENGVRHTEPVQLRPTRGGIEYGTNRDAHPEFKLATEQEHPNISTEEPSHGLPGTVPPSDARPSAEGVQAPEPERGPRSPSSDEGERGGAVAPKPVEGRPEGQERPSEPAAPTGGGGEGAGGAVGLPGRSDHSGEGREGLPPERKPSARVTGENHVIEPGALDEGRSLKTKAADNVRAIELARMIEAEGRPATQAEQADLARYTGWGGIKGAFPDTDGKFGKGFEAIGEKLKTLLDPTEYATARRSIQYAHYTSEDVVRAMWAAAEQFGFKGGHQIFEPGMGVGNFAGMMPRDLANNSHYVGLELDHTTARIAKLLYPKWGVRRDDFTKAPLPENTFDLIIGNPPFADVVIKADPKYAKHNFLLHDYFFAKSLDAVRPGGMLMFISSAGTMNKIDPSARQYLAGKADLVGAVRLPSSAFEKSAGTEVTTDIIVLRKRLPDEVPGDNTWTETVERELPNKEGKIVKGAVNRYFSEHPEMVLGKEGFFDKLYEGRYAVHAPKGFDLKGELTKAFEHMPHDVLAPWEEAHKAEYDFGTSEKKEGTFYLGDDGRLMQMRDGMGRPVERRGAGVEGGRSAADIERIQGLVPVRDALRAVYAADLVQDTANSEKARERLNKSYDAFVQKYGPVNKAEIQRRRPNSIQQEVARAEAREEARYAGLSFDEGSFDPSDMIKAGATTMAIARARKEAKLKAETNGKKWDEGSFDPEDMPDVIIDKRPNVDPFMDDPESYRLRAIEHYNEATGRGEKSKIFFENVISRQREPEIKSVNDAVLHVLNQRGRLDVPHIAELVGKSESETIEELGDRIFRDPGSDHTWVTRDQYLSGNVRKKLALAKAEAERNPEYRRNVEALEAAQPIPLGPAQIHATMGMPWLPEATIRDFGMQELGLESVKVKYIPALAQWFVEGDTESAAASTTWGTDRRRAPSLISDALNRQTPKIYDQIREPGGNTKLVLNVEATQAAQEKLQAIKDKFSGWVWREPERADALAALYNEHYNNLVTREYDGSYLTTPGVSTAWQWRPHQTRVISRIILSGNTYMAHAVGAGKTSAMIGAGMEMRRLGLVRKPMYAVPNHMLAQFTKEFYEQYPTARIAVADERRFHTDRRKQFIANVAGEDLDAVIITHSAFGMIPVSDTFSDKVIQDELDDYRAILAEIPKDRENRVTRSRIEKQIERLEQRLAGRSKGRKDQVFTFEEMGVDFLFVDEAHLFRKLDFATNMGSVKGIDPQGSQAAWDLYVKSLYLDSVNPSRSLVLASGTPVTNTMAELYTLSRYLQRQELAERGLAKFDAWAGAFGAVKAELEQDAAGGYKTVTRFAEFLNTPELSAMVRQNMDVVTSKQLEQYVTRPKLKGGKRIMNLAEKSPQLEQYQRTLAERMKAIQERKRPPQPGDDIMLSVINDGRHAAIDMRLVYPDMKKDPGSKLSLLVDNVHRIWKETKRQNFYAPKAEGGYDLSKPVDIGPATQLIFTNLGISGTRGFSTPEYIRSELVRRGVPRNEIAFIYDYKTHAARGKLANDVREGKIRVLIGSTQKMATGLNVQPRLFAIHNMDPLWFPSDDEQRNGRGLRQGNLNPEIEIHDYSTKGTYDSTMWGMMARKARFIEAFFNGDPTLRKIEDLGEASQYEQAKAITTNDPRLIKLTELKQALEKAERSEGAFQQEQYALRQRRSSARSEAKHLADRIKATKEDIAQRQDTSGDKFKAKIGATTFAKRAEFADALLDKLEKVATLPNVGRDMPIGEIGGFPLTARISKETVTNKEGQKEQRAYPYWLSLRFNENFERATNVTASGLGMTQSLENHLRGLEGDMSYYQDKKAKAEKFLADSEEASTATFQGGEEIERLRREVETLQSELAAPPVQEPVATDPTSISSLDELFNFGLTGSEEIPKRAVGLSAPEEPFPAPGEILSPRSLSTQTAPDLRAKLKELENQQRSLMQLRPMVPTLIKLGVTPEQMTRMTPPEAYQFIKARSPQGMGKVDRDADKVIEETIDKIREQRAAITDALLIEQGLSAPEEPFPAPSVGPVFYSAVQRAIIGAKQEKASPNQWIGMLKNTPGVKAEEMQWLNLEEWLRDHKGPVTKAELADYVRAHQVEVREVRKGELEQTPEYLAYKQQLERRGYRVEGENVYQGNRLIEGASDAGGDRHLVQNFYDVADAPARRSETKFGQYQLPGGENYRELLLTLPSKEVPVSIKGWKVRDLGDDASGEWRGLEIVDPEGKVRGTSRDQIHNEDEILYNFAVNQQGADYRTSHWDEPNVLAHARFNDRVIDGKKTLFLEEIQSDWHQKGRERGYQGQYKGRSIDEINRDMDANLAELGRREPNDDTLAAWTRHPELFERHKRLQQEYNAAAGANEGVPDAPFKTTWPELALKRMLRYAAEHGYEQVAWTPGEVQADRYDLSKQAKIIEWIRQSDGQYAISITDHGNVSHDIGTYPEEKLSDVIGKELADKVVADKRRIGEFEGLDLKVGGEGMVGFYDKMLPAAANKLGKKFGAKVGVVGLKTKPKTYAEAIRQEEPLAEKSQSVHVLPITSALREAAVRQGFALFQPQALARVQKGETFDSWAARAYPKFTPHPDKPLGEQAQSHVLRRGLDTGVEHALAIDSDGKVVAELQGTDKHVAFTPALERLMADPGEAIVAHHTHPSNGPLSIGDVAALGRPGLKAIWAHGHEGAVSRAELTEEARNALARFPDIETRIRGLAAIITEIDNKLLVHEWQAINAGRITRDKGNLAHHQVRNLILHDAGLIDLHHNIDIGDYIEKAGLTFFMRRASSAIRQALFNEPAATDATRRPDRRSGPLRHPGDLGTSLGRPQDIARQHREGSGDRARGEAYRSDEASAGAGLSAPSNPFRRGAQSREPDEEAILSRIVPSQRGSRLPQTPREIYTAAFDDLNPIAYVAKKLAEDIGTTLPTEQDPYKLARLTRGSLGRAEQFLLHGTYDFETLHNNGIPLDKVLEPVRSKLDAFRAYIVAKRALELEGRGVPTGVPLTEAHAIVARGRAEFGPVQRELVAYQDRVLKYLQKSGILSADGVQAMRAANRDYVPFFRLMTGEKDLGHALGAGLKVRDPVKGIKGSERQIIDPIESIVKNTYLFIGLAERNRALTALEDLANRSQIGRDFMKPVPRRVRPIEVTAEEINRHLQNEGIDEEVSDTMTIFRPNAFRPNSDEIALFRNGKRKIYKVGKELAEAVNALDRDTLNLVTRMLSVPARTLRAGAVLAPEFIARNPVRDQFTALAFSDHGYLPVYDFIRGLGHLFQKGDVYQNWLKGGGANAAMVAIDRNYISRNILELEEPSTLKKVGKIAKSPIDLLRALSEMFENATRIGEANRALGRGQTPMTAGYAAREVTLDFARMGAQTKSINALVAFWNAQVQGVDRAARAVKDHPFRTLLTLALSITLPSILLWLANHDDERYKELPRWEKDFYWHIFTDHWESVTPEMAAKYPKTYKRQAGNQWQINNGTIWRVPKPFELGVLFGSVPERILDAFFTKTKMPFKGIANSAIQALMPPFIPQITAPFIEHFANRSTFFDRPIVPKYLEDVSPKYQAQPYTTDTAKIIGSAIAKINDKTSFASPLVIENYIRDWTGGLGTHILAVIDMGLRASGITPAKNNPDPTLADMPAIKGFVSRFPSPNATSIQDFYDNYAAHKRASSTTKYLTKTKQIEAAQEEREKNDPMTGGIESIHKIMGNQLKAVRGIYADPKMPPRDKRQLIDSIYLQMIEGAKRGNALMEASEQRRIRRGTAPTPQAELRP
jgi:N12 class adenine-specific DNA methylase